MSTKTWEEVRREKEERILKARRERALSTPLETTSTDAMDMEEAQEISKEIAEKAAERELKKQKYAQYQKTKQTADYKVPKTDPIPVPDLTKPRQKKEGQPPSALSNFDVPQYEEISGYGNKWQLGMQSASATPRLSDKRGQVEKAKPRIPLRNITTFQDYIPVMMTTLDRVLTMMIVGMEMILHPQQILLLLEGEGMGSPNMFMCYKGLQDHQARKDNLDNLDKQEEMAEMCKHCHWLEP